LAGIPGKTSAGDIKVSMPAIFTCGVRILGGWKWKN